MKFRWNRQKAVLNEEKHGVTFREAATVWKDRYFLILTDDAHSYEEEKYRHFH